MLVCLQDRAASAPQTAARYISTGGRERRPAAADSAQRTANASMQRQAQGTHRRKGTWQPRVSGARMSFPSSWALLRGGGSMRTQFK